MILNKLTLDEIEAEKNKCESALEKIKADREKPLSIQGRLNNLIFDEQIRSDEITQVTKLKAIARLLSDAEKASTINQLHSWLIRDLLSGISGLCDSGLELEMKAKYLKAKSDLVRIIEIFEDYKPELQPEVSNGLWKQT